MSKNQKNSKNKGGPAEIANRRARFDYEILETYEAGIALLGPEVKSLWKGKANLTDSYCRILNHEAWILSMDVEPYEYSTAFAPDRRRDRKLLLHKKELANIERKTKEKGLSLIPLKLYFGHSGKVKALIGLGKGKKLYDKRTQIAEKETRREKERAFSEKFQI